VRECLILTQWIHCPVHVVLIGASGADARVGVFEAVAENNGKRG